MIDFLKFVNQSDEDKYNMLLQGQSEIQKLKSNLEEIIEYIKINTKEEYENIEVDEHFASILQIINKGEENE